LFEDDCPRIEEDHFNIKEEKKHGDDVILDGYPAEA
jgi:hypothetical protein